MDRNIVDKKFAEWTSGLGPKEARISIFNHIRDIPYAIIPELRSPEDGPSGILEKNHGSCQPKHWLMAILFKKLNIPVKYATYPFRWEDCGIRFPPDLDGMVKHPPVSYHLALKAFIDGRWIPVDATYDLPLAKAGFPVTENWDGVSPTKNAVKAIEEVLHDTPEERVRYEAEKKMHHTEAQKAASVKFIEKLNDWLESARKTKGTVER